jgi:hypothetical protein
MMCSASSIQIMHPLALCQVQLYSSGQSPLLQGQHDSHAGALLLLGSHAAISA